MRLEQIELARWMLERPKARMATVAAALGVSKTVLRECLELADELSASLTAGADPMAAIAPPAPESASPEDLAAELAAEGLGEGKPVRRARAARPQTAIDLTGQRFARLTVIERAEGRDAKGGALWRCRCECGQPTVTAGWRLRNRSIKSCGCMRGRPRPGAACAKKPGTIPPPAAKAPAPAPRHGYDEEEQAAIEAAIAAGKVTRIRNGEFPDSDRLEIMQPWYRQRWTGPDGQDLRKRGDG